MGAVQKLIRMVLWVALAVNTVYLLWSWNATDETLLLLWVFATVLVACYLFGLFDSKPRQAVERDSADHSSDESYIYHASMAAASMPDGGDEPACADDSNESASDSDSGGDSDSDCDID